MSEAEAEGAPDARGTRIQTLIARAGLASRRAAEALILAGRVTMNGAVVSELGARALPADELAVDGKPIKAEERLRYILLNKPPGYLCASSDDRGRPLALDLLKPDIPERVYNVGRLDLASSGLVLFTNDGEFAAKAGHPSFGLIKEYEVETDGRVHPDFPAAFQKGLAEGGETLRAERVEQYGARRLRIWLAEGKNREIRRALELFRLRARVLKRVAIGPIRIDGLAEGRWRPLAPAELAALNDIFSRNPR